MNTRSMFPPVLSRKVFSSAQSSAHIIPVTAGCVMVIASLLPWFRSPFGEVFSAWKLSVDLGWQFQSSMLNYGLLCLGCACYCFFLAIANWKAQKAGQALYGSTWAGLLCLMPLAFFLLQYLFLDFGTMILLAKQKDQIILAQAHFGYNVGPDFFGFRPFTVDISTFSGRFQLLADQSQVGALVPLVAVWILLDLQHLRHSAAAPRQSMHPCMIAAIAIFCAVFLAMFSSAAGWEVSEQLAQESAALGNYSGSLQWLDRALLFNPALDETVFYHVERGQILYRYRPGQLSVDSRAYLASIFLSQNEYQSSYQELLMIWQMQKAPSWAVDDLSSVLEHLAESYNPAQIRYLPASTQKILRQDSSALPWLQVLIRVDPGNVYGQYLIGRIDCDLSEYEACSIYMSAVLHLTADTNLQSSAYTYIALSDAGRGDYANERLFLLQAALLDPSYRNITARQELSGLR